MTSRWTRSTCGSTILIIFSNSSAELAIIAGITLFICFSYVAHCIIKISANFFSGIEYVLRVEYFLGLIEQLQDLRVEHFFQIRRPYQPVVMLTGYRAVHGSDEFVNLFRKFGNGFAVLFFAEIHQRYDVEVGIARVSGNRIGQTLVLADQFVELRQES